MRKRLFLILLATASAAGKSCTAVSPGQCTETNNCLKCGAASDYDCEQCCPGCKQVAAPPYKYCV